MDMRQTNFDPQYPDAKSSNSFQEGLEFQDFVCSRLAKQGIILQNFSSKKYQIDIGENLQGFEIKLDSQCTKYGRLSIEVAEKSRDDGLLSWSDSGIMRNDNSWLYIQGNYEVLFVFSKSWLHRLFIGKQPEVSEKFGTIKTFYMKLDFARKHAAKTIDFR